MVQKQVEDLASSDKSPPFSIVEFSNQRVQELDALSLPDDAQTVVSAQSNKLTCKTLPSYLGLYEAHSQIMQVPSMTQQPHQERDIGSLQALMSAPVTCTIPLAEFLKLRPRLWGEVATQLTEQGLWNQNIQVKELLKAKSPELMFKQTILVPVSWQAL